jgi:hypothetical protein
MATDTFLKLGIAPRFFSVSKHAQTSKHPVIASAEPGERWLYCYPDDSFA